MVLQPCDMEVGAGTFHPATTLRSLGPRPWNAATCKPSRRPKTALRREPQLAAALLSVPGDPEAVAAGPAGPLSRLAGGDRRRCPRCTTSVLLRTTGKARRSAPGAWLRILVRRQLEVSQFTYFQQVGGFGMRTAVSGELTHGLRAAGDGVQGRPRLHEKRQRPRLSRNASLQKRRGGSATCSRATWYHHATQGTEKNTPGTISSLRR